MAHRKMAATGALRYGTRMLQAGEELTLSGPRARLEEALGRFETPTARRRAKPAPPAPAINEIAVLRATYYDTFGKRPFNGWDADALKAKIEAA